MEIYLKDIVVLDGKQYKDWTICLNNANEEGVYSFEENESRLLEHISWKKHRNSTTSFRNINTRYCLQFIRLDRDKKYNQWLFLGAFEICGVISFDDGHQVYDLKKMDLFNQYSERLIIEYSKKQGPKQAKIGIENIETIKVVSILEKKYVKTSQLFEGYHKVSLPFLELKKIIMSNVDNWRILLENVNCIYSIVDETNGKIYIGSTYNKNGTWSRWSEYVYTNGHGNDCELKQLVESQPDYAKNFRFSIIEVFLNKDDTSPYILERERYWKEVFRSKIFGYNDN